MNENKNIEKHTSFIFEGNISVKAAIEAENRDIFEVIVDSQKKDKDTNYILKVAKTKNILITYTSKEEIEKLTSGKTHGGLIARVGERKFQSVNFNENCIALVEGIEDPYNFAHIVRSLYAFGIHTLLIPTRNWNTASDILVKTSAGASEKMRMCIFDDFTDIIQQLKANHFTVVGANRKDAIALDEYHFQLKTLICIGGEMRGISKKVLNLCDDFVYIPYGSDFRNSLTAVSASSVLAYEYLKQIKNK